MMLGLSTAQEDSQPLGRYLQTERLAAVWSRLGPQLAPCGAGLPDGAWPLHFNLTSQGRAVDVQVDAALTPSAAVSTRDSLPTPPPPGLAACLELALSQADLPGHDELVIPVRTTVVLRSGLAGPGPVLRTSKREVRLLFLSLPPWLSPSDLSQVESALGVGLPPATGPAKGPQLPTQ